jgi:hypothetical protein
VAIDDLFELTIDHGETTSPTAIHVVYAVLRRFSEFDRFSFFEIARNCSRQGFLLSGDQ